MEREYRPLDCLLHAGSEKLGLLILNQPLDGPERLQLLWSKSVIRACADGGANALYKCMGNSRDRFIPDFISGDFDSIEKAVEEYYKEKGSDFIKTPDQDHTDFTKALQLLLQRARDHNTKIDMVVTLGGLSGRFDQILASVNTLYHARPLTNLPVYVIHGSSLICLLREVGLPLMRYKKKSAHSMGRRLSHNARKGMVCCYINGKTRTCIVPEDKQISQDSYLKKRTNLGKPGHVATLTGSRCTIVISCNRKQFWRLIQYSVRYDIAVYNILI
ncbi:thiamine pyrophosphokinase 1 isoform X1 [Lampetra fluviatilis]